MKSRLQSNVYVGVKFTSLKFLRISENFCFIAPEVEEGAGEEGSLTRELLDLYPTFTNHFQEEEWVI